MTRKEIEAIGLTLDSDAPASYQVMDGTYTPISIAKDRAEAFKTPQELLLYINSNALERGKTEGRWTKEKEIQRALGLLK